MVMPERLGEALDPEPEKYREWMDRFDAMTERLGIKKLSDDWMEFTRKYTKDFEWLEWAESNLQRKEHGPI